MKKNDSNSFPRVYQDARPKVLLLGNGINRSFAMNSWENMLEVLQNHFRTHHLEAKEMPFPMQAILYTENKIREGVKVIADNVLDVNVPTPLREMLEEIFDIGFDAILTTNYSYELEACLADDFKIEQLPRKYQNHTGYQDQADVKFLLHTFNRFEHHNLTQRIWHIHGEGRKTGSIVLGHEYYGKLIGKYREYIKEQEYFRKEIPKRGIEIKSWIDLFMYGDVHILGFGFDYAEIDLWWLLNEKFSMKQSRGRTFYYDLPPEAFQNTDSRKVLQKANHHRLLSVLGVEVRCDGPSEYLEMYTHCIKGLKEINEDS